MANPKKETKPAEENETPEQLVARLTAEKAEAEKAAASHPAKALLAETMAGAIKVEQGKEAAPAANVIAPPKSTTVDSANGAAITVEQQ